MRTRTVNFAPAPASPLRSAAPITRALLLLCLPLCGCSTLNSIEHSVAGLVGGGEESTAAAAPRETTTARPGKDFYTGKYSFVRIEASEAGATSALPVSVDATRLSALLGEIKGSGSDFKGKPLFSAEELSEMAPVLADALSQARSGQDVVFASSGKHSGASLFETESVTTGRLFVEGGRLQLIFGMTRVNFGDELRGNHTLKPFVIGSRNKSLASAAPVGGASWATRAGREDWLSLDPQQLAKGAVPDVPQAMPAVSARASAPAAASPVAVPASGPAASAPIDAEAAERRLSTLQRLRQKGLISEQEYQDKRKAVLDGL